jgi:hypothetical protein
VQLFQIEGADVHPAVISMRPKLVWGHAGFTAPGPAQTKVFGAAFFKKRLLS